MQFLSWQNLHRLQNLFSPFLGFEKEEENGGTEETAIVSPTCSLCSLLPFQIWG